jgi:diguanylate cyclase (GGDEF)-like protein/PAS domain S-box-containing protein
MLGYTRDELVGMTVEAVTHPDDLDADVELARRLFSGELPSYVIEKRYLRADGSEMLGRLNASVLRNPTGEVVQSVATVEDVTETVRARQLLADREQRLQLALEAAQVVTWSLDISTGTVEVSENFERAWGLAPGSFNGSYAAFADLVHPGDRAVVSVEDLLAPGQDDEFAHEFRIVNSSGAQRVIHSRGRVERDADGCAVRIVGAGLDVTQQRRAEAGRLAAEAIFRRTIDASNDAFIGVDREHRVTDWNAAAETIFGWTAEGAMGRDVVDLLFRGPDAPHVRQLLEQALAGDGGALRGRRELTARHRDGRVVTIDASTVVITVGDTPAVKMFVRDITERRALEEQLTRQALSDPHTGLPNRALLRDRLRSGIARLSRSNGTLAVCFIDLDRFKVVNDSLGHDAGDELLAVIAHRLRTIVRPGDTVARFGGDEFIVLAEGLHTPSEVAGLAERITGELGKPVKLGTHEVTPGASIGIAVTDDPQALAEHLIRDADLAMYRAKELGGSRFTMFDETMRLHAVARLDMEADLRRAIDMSELRVHYQPILDFDGTIVAVEALARWEHPIRGLIGPADFIPLAEETGLVVPVGAAVLREACARVAHWRAAIAPSLRVSVNLSSRQLAEPGIVEFVEQTMIETGLEPDALCLEITETSLTADAPTTAARLADLRGLGVRLAIDDFGTGYSSLLYLRRFPVQLLKLDRFFVAGVCDERDDNEILRAIIGLAHALGMRAVAEGVESREQLDALAVLGCDFVQGFYWSPPVPSTTMDDILSGERSLVAGQTTSTLLPSGAPGAPDQPRRATPALAVLVVDDSPGDRSLLRAGLGESSTLRIVDEVEDADAAVDAAARHQPDVILLDLALPRRDGLDAIADLRAAAPQAKIVVLSGFVSEGVREIALKAGAAACIDKTISAEGLATELAALAASPLRMSPNR